MYRLAIRKSGKLWLLAEHQIVRTCVLFRQFGYLDASRVGSCPGVMGKVTGDVGSSSDANVLVIVE
jgi:hypothetical protein